MSRQFKYSSVPFPDRCAVPGAEAKTLQELYLVVLRDTTSGIPSITRRGESVALSPTGGDGPSTSEQTPTRQSNASFSSPMSAGGRMPPSRAGTNRLCRAVLVPQGESAVVNPLPGVGDVPEAVDRNVPDRHSWPQHQHSHLHAKKFLLPKDPDEKHRRLTLNKKEALEVAEVGEGNDAAIVGAIRSIKIHSKPLDAYCPSCCKRWDHEHANRQKNFCGSCYRCPVCSGATNVVEGLSADGKSSGKVVLYCPSCMWRSAEQDTVRDLAAFLQTLNPKKQMMGYQADIRSRLKQVTGPVPSASALAKEGGNRGQWKNLERRFEPPLEGTVLMDFRLKQAERMLQTWTTDKQRRPMEFPLRSSIKTGYTSLHEISERPFSLPHPEVFNIAGKKVPEGHHDGAARMRSPTILHKPTSPTTAGGHGGLGPATPQEMGRCRADGLGTVKQFLNQRCVYPEHKQVAMTVACEATHDFDGEDEDEPLGRDAETQGAFHCEETQGDWLDVEPKVQTCTVSDDAMVIVTNEIAEKERPPSVPYASGHKEPGSVYLSGTPLVARSHVVAELHDFAEQSTVGTILNPTLFNPIPPEDLPGHGGGAKAITQKYSMVGATTSYSSSYRAHRFLPALTSAWVITKEHHGKSFFFLGNRCPFPVSLLGLQIHHIEGELAPGCKLVCFGAVNEAPSSPTATASSQAFADPSGNMNSPSNTSFTTSSALSPTAGGRAGIRGSYVARTTAIESCNPDYPRLVTTAAGVTLVPSVTDAAMGGSSSAKMQRPYVDLEMAKMIEKSAGLLHEDGRVAFGWEIQKDKDAVETTPPSPAGPRERPAVVLKVVVKVPIPFENPSAASGGPSRQRSETVEIPYFIRVPL